MAWSVTATARGLGSFGISLDDQFLAQGRSKLTLDLRGFSDKGNV